MIKSIRIVNFRQIEDERINLDSVVVVVGPNNGGKTTFLQAISLFALAVRDWGEQVGPRKKRKKGIAINLDEILNIPISEFKEIWTNQRLRKRSTDNDGKTITENIRIKIHASGSTKNKDGIYKDWKMGFEYNYINKLLIHARPTEDENGQQYEFPDILMEEHVGYLPSVATLKPSEDKLEIGSILRNIDTGNAADVLRNICYQLYTQETTGKWKEFTEIMRSIFRIKVNVPWHILATGLLKISYSKKDVKNIDLSSLGSGSKQAILLFAYILAFPNTIILLDEPDAHLETIRQLNIYDRISDLAKHHNNQVVIASHSESIMNRAFDKNSVIAGVFGIFKNIEKNDGMKELLTKYGYDEYIIARQYPMILYGEGSTDFDFLKAFCKKLGMKELLHLLETEVYFRRLGGNVTTMVKQHFTALKKFIPELHAYAIFDNLRKKVESEQKHLIIKQWERNEIENYLPLPETIYNYAKKEWDTILRSTNINKPDLLKAIIEDSTAPVVLRTRDHDFWKKTKISDDYLAPIFEQFFKKIDFPLGTMDKSKYYRLVKYCDDSLIDQEIRTTLEEMQKFFEKALKERRGSL